MVGVLVVVAGGCGTPVGGPAGGTSANVTTTPDSRPLDDPSAWNSPPVDDPSARATRIAEFSRRRAPEAFAGTALNKAGPAILVYRKPGSGLDQAVTTIFAGVPVEFVDAVRSEVELRAVLDQVLGAAKEWSEQGVRVRSASMDFVHGRVEVMSPDGDRAVDLLKRRYGDVVEVVDGDVVPPTMPGTSRR
ncbi:hypothetical protein AB0I60_19080 [Actinosynnema sp. NPDC050436]|uniref:hypothetical protein n=1 Tax=Actinosynnema sp. NPDC050436 TaxID=3155659 RepID=UPI0033C308FF